MPNLGNIRDTRLGKAYNLAEAGLRGPKPLIVDRFARYVFPPSRANPSSLTASPVTQHL